MPVFVNTVRADRLKLAEVRKRVDAKIGYLKEALARAKVEKVKAEADGMTEKKKEESSGGQDHRDRKKSQGSDCQD